MPTAPPPTASIQEVESFFRDYFLAIKDTISREEAETRARQLSVNGSGLYILPVDSFKDAFGPEGRGIFEMLVKGNDHSGLLSNLARNSWDSWMWQPGFFDVQKTLKRETSPSHALSWEQHQQQQLQPGCHCGIDSKQPGDVVRNRRYYHQDRD